MAIKGNAPTLHKELNEKKKKHFPFSCNNLMKHPFKKRRDA